MPKVAGKGYFFAVTPARGPEEGVLWFVNES